MKYKEDEKLTDSQKDMKWSLYCECELEDNQDIKKVLMSLLEDIGK